MATALVVLLAAVKAYLPCTVPNPPKTSGRISCVQARENLVAAAEGAEKFAKSRRTETSGTVTNTFCLVDEQGREAKVGNGPAPCDN